MTSPSQTLAHTRSLGLLGVLLVAVFLLLVYTGHEAALQPFALLASTVMGAGGAGVASYGGRHWGARSQTSEERQRAALRDDP